MQDNNTASGLSKASLICGICAIIPFVGNASGLAAIIMGIIDLVKISKGESGAAGKGKDIAGIVMGVVFPIIMWVILSLTLFATVTALATGAAEALGN
jgi:hypothetical protein